jgi:hypothetical protein
MDLRLRPLIPAFAGLTAVFAAFTFLWTCRLLRSNPKITVRHQAFALAAAAATVGAAVFLVFLVLWNARGICSRALLALSALTAAGSRALLLFLTFSGLQEPSELPLWPFATAGVFLGFGFLVEQFGIVEFSCRSTGAWILGIGKIPFAQFAILAVCQLVLLIWAARAPPPESRGSPQRNWLLAAFAVIVVVFLGTSLGTAASRTGAKIGTVIEWWPFIIEPICFGALSGATGVFWMLFNPYGWEVLDNHASRDVTVDAESAGAGESLVGGGILPQRGREKPEFVLESDDDNDSRL